MAAAPFVLTVDVGTSALKAVVYSRAGQVLATAARRYAYATPQPGWAEADPHAWWEALESCFAELAHAPGGLHQVQAIVLTGQMHTAVLLDSQGNVVPPTILWLDRRAAAETTELQAQLGLPPYQLNSTYTLPKLLWLSRHQPEALRRCACILWPKDYLRYRLTGELLTDYTEVGGAALLDWGAMTWARSRMDLVGAGASILPPLRRPEDDGGPLLPDLAARFGLNLNARVLVGAGDVLALITGAPPRPGQVTCSLGSSSMVFAPLPADRTVLDPTGRLYVYPLLPYPLLGGVSSTTGAAVQWAWQMLFGKEVTFAEAITQALRTDSGAGGLVFLPFLSGERSPFWNDGLRGAFYGLTLSHGRAELLRAVLEGVAFSLRYLLDLFAGLGVHLDTIALAGGGSSTPGWSQMMADVCRLPVHVYAAEETVTRALYAYACVALDAGERFDQALARTFGAPAAYEPCPDQEPYEQPYRTYRLLAEFADKTLARSEAAVSTVPLKDKESPCSEKPDE